MLDGVLRGQSVLGVLSNSDLYGAMRGFCAAWKASVAASEDIDVKVRNCCVCICVRLLLSDRAGPDWPPLYG